MAVLKMEWRMGYDDFVDGTIMEFSLHEYREDFVLCEDVVQQLC
jgi:hypothetical protein